MTCFTCPSRSCSYSRPRVRGQRRQCLGGESQLGHGCGVCLHAFFSTSERARVYHRSFIGHEMASNTLEITKSFFPLVHPLLVNSKVVDVTWARNYWSPRFVVPVSGCVGHSRPATATRGQLANVRLNRGLSTGLWSRSRRRALEQPEQATPMGQQLFCRGISAAAALQTPVWSSTPHSLTPLSRSLRWPSIPTTTCGYD